MRRAYSLTARQVLATISAAMALTTKLELRQGQQLVMTPQLQQAIRLLQLSNIELSAFVESELEKNPLLEREDALAEDHAAPGEPRSEREAQDAWSGGDGNGPGARSDAATASTIGEPESSGWAALRPRMRNAFGGEDASLEEVVAAGTSLADHLIEQLHVAIVDPAERLIGVHLIHMVDEGGYLVGDLGDLAAKLGAPDSLIDKVLRQLQGFDPPGVLARNLAECLTLQLRERNRYDPQIARLRSEERRVGKEC